MRFEAANMSVVCALEISRKHGKVFDREDLREDFVCSLNVHEHKQYVRLCQSELGLNYVQKPVVEEISSVFNREFTGTDFNGARRYREMDRFSGRDGLPRLSRD